MQVDVVLLQHSDEATRLSQLYATEAQLVANRAPLIAGSVVIWRALGLVSGCSHLPWQRRRQRTRHPRYPRLHPI
jgi:hypothetical protein